MPISHVDRIFSQLHLGFSSPREAHSVQQQPRRQRGRDACRVVGRRHLHQVQAHEAALREDAPQEVLHLLRAIGDTGFG